MRKLMLLFALVMLGAVLLTGCGGSGPRTAEDYLNANDQEELDEAIAMTRAMGMELDISTDGDILIYTYTFIQEIDADLFILDPTDLRETAETDILPEMSDFGVENPAVRFVYLNADGSLLDEFEFR